MVGNCGTRRARRFVLLTMLAALASLALSAPALAEGGLTSIVSGAVPETGTSLDQAVDDNLEAASPILDTATPAVETAKPVLEPVTTAVESTQPVVEKATAPVVQAAAPVLDTAAPVLDSTAPVVQDVATVTAPVTDSVSDLTESTLGTVDQVVRTATPVTVSVQGTTSTTESVLPAGDALNANVGAGTGSAPLVAHTSEQQVTGSATRVPPMPGSTRTLGRMGGSAVSSRGSEWPLPAIASGGIWSSSAATQEASAGRAHTSANPPGAPSREAPSVPGALGSIAAGTFGGGALLLFAALAVTLLLAAPGMSRRLRLMLDSPPLPVSGPSLERPG